MYMMVDNYTYFEKTNEFKWMQNNAYKYGFILRFPKDKTMKLVMNMNLGIIDMLENLCKRNKRKKYIFRRIYCYTLKRDLIKSLFKILI